MAEPPVFGVQFFRQWVGDLGIPDNSAGDTLDEAKAFAKERLVVHAQTLQGRERPRVARVFVSITHEIRAEFRIAADGAVNLIDGANQGTVETSVLVRAGPLQLRGRRHV